MEKSQQIQQNFNSIKELRNQVMLCFNALEIKQQRLKKTTIDFVSNNKHNLFIFGLDSFQFQSKLIDYEYNDMKKYYFALNNRMYCEYYKLYKLILNYVEETIGSNKNIELLKMSNVFPVYKDLEPFKQYDFEIIVELHKTILILLNDLNDHIVEKDSQLKTFMLKQQSGLNINNFVNTYDFDIIVIKQKRTLYLSYLEFFHHIHTKHFKRFAKKMKLMNDYLDEDIKFDEDSKYEIESTSSSDTHDDENIIVKELQIENAIVSPTVQKSNNIQSLFKSKVKSVMNTLKLTTNTNPSPKQNINALLESLTTDCDRIMYNIEEPIKSNVIVEETDVLREETDVTTENPDVLQEKPDVLREEADVTTENPDVLQEKPDVITENPDVLQEKPDVIIEKPDVLQEKSKRKYNRKKIS
jgi:hypothetical protein